MAGGRGSKWQTRAAYNKLAAYTKQLAAEHNKHEERIIALEAQVKDLTDVLTETLARAGDRFATLVTELDRTIAEDKAAGA
jgi:DNA anti-recombination protein RmuC